MNFGQPNILWLMVAVVGLLIGFLWWSWRKRAHLISQFVQSRLLAQLTVGISAQRLKIKWALLVCAVVSLFLTLARPQWGFDWQEVKQRGLDIVVAIDTSRSMLASDIAPNRLERSKLAALDLMAKAKSDRLALVAFAGSAFLQCPLTLDEDAFRQSVDAVEVGIIPQGGSAITEAIKAALEAYEKDNDNHKILVLFTDGEDHDAGAEETAKIAKDAGMRIFTIGVGTSAGELIRVTDDKGQNTFLKDEAGNVVKSKLNELLLQQIATSSQGFYLPLRGANTMDTLYERGLAPLPKSDIAAKLTRRYHERFQWPLAFAIAFLIAEIFFPEQKRTRREKESTTTTKAGLKKAVSLITLLLVTGSLQASPASALRQYQSKNYGAALREYKTLLEKNPDDAKLSYNAGAAAYKASEFESATKYFTAATRAEELELQQQAFYNLGNTLYGAGNQQQEPQARMENWEQSVKNYESALKLNPNDGDAKHNLEMVKRMLEELKKQQQQQKDQKGDQKKDDKNQDSKDQQDQQKQDQQKQDQKDSNQSKDQQQQQQDKQESNQPKDSQEKKDQQQQQQNNQPKPEEKKGQNEQAKSQEQKDGGKEEAGEATPYALGKMTPEQAKQLLEAQKGDEKAMIFQPQGQPKKRSVRDW